MVQGTFQHFLHVENHQLDFAPHLLAHSNTPFSSQTRPSADSLSQLHQDLPLESRLFSKNAQSRVVVALNFFIDRSIPLFINCLHSPACSRQQLWRTDPASQVHHNNCKSAFWDLRKKLVNFNGWEFFFWISHLQLFDLEEAHSTLVKFGCEERRTSLPHRL